MKNKVNNKQGFALTGVIVLIAVMTLFGTAMYSYSMQALKTLEYGTNKQKAEYLARSGIEASVYLYQDSLLKQTDLDNDPTQMISKFLDESSYDKGADGQIITNWVYLLKKPIKVTDANGKQTDQYYVDGGNGETPDAIEDEYIGYFRVTVTSDAKEVDMPTGAYNQDGSAVTEKKTEYTKNFHSVAYVGNGSMQRVAKKDAYIIPTVDISDKNWISDDGIIQLDTATEDETSVIYESTISIDCGLIDKLINWAGSSTIIGKWFPHINTNRLSNVPFYLGCTSGNLVVSKPDNSDKIWFGENTLKDHIQGLLSLSNLFIETQIDVKPDVSQFNMLYLRGNQIVIDDEINLYAYDPGINFSQKQQQNQGFFEKLFSNIQAIAAKISRQYRLGTIVIGTPSTQMTTVTDDSVGGLGECGKIFFGGDVYLNFMSSEGTRKYKVFSAGDVYYFNGDYKITSTVNGKTTESAYGIDIVKYFLDTAGDRGYSGNTLKQFERTRDFYYNDSNEEYTTDDMRKIEVGKNGDTIDEIIIPSYSDTAYIIWQ